MAAIANVYVRGKIVARITDDEDNVVEVLDGLYEPLTLIEIGMMIPPFTEPAGSIVARKVVAMLASVGEEAQIEVLDPESFDDDPPIYDEPTPEGIVY